MTIYRGSAGLLQDLVRDPHRKNGEKKRKRALVYPPAGKAGVVSAEMGHALNEMGVDHESFDMVLGSSSGGYNATSFCTGQAKEVTRVYAHLCPMSYWMPTVHNFQLLNLQQYLTVLMREQLRVERLDKISADLRIGVAYLHDGFAAEKWNRCPDVFQLLQASASIFPFWNGLMIGTELAMDGGYGDPSAVGHVVRRFLQKDEEVDVLVLSGRSELKYIPDSEWREYEFFLRTLFWAYPLALSRALACRRKITSFEQALSTPERARIRIGALFPSPEEIVHHDERDAPSLTQKALRVFDTSQRVFAAYA